MISKEGATPSSQGPLDPLIGRVLAGRYHVQELVAKGGMGRIYRAEQQPLGRTVAVKVLHVADASEDDGRFRERFFREASISSRLKHPNTVRIFDYGNEGETFFIVMEFLEGRTLTEAIKVESPMPANRAISLARQICRSLAEAHAQGVIHRDLKPSNIILCRHGDQDFVKVLDFGLVKSMEHQSRVTQAGKILGSPMYMAPEQVLGQPVTPQTDVYALGMVMYAMLTKTLPFKRDHPMAVLNAQVNAALPTFARIAPHVDVPKNLEWVVRTCLAKGQGERFESMGEAERALRLCARHDDTLELSLSAGRLVVPAGIEETSLDGPTGTTPTASGMVAGVVEPVESLTSPTLAQRAARPALEFLLAAIVVLLLLMGAAGAAGVGWFFGTKDRVAPAQPTLTERAAVPPEPALLELEEPAAPTEAPAKVEATAPQTTKSQPAKSQTTKSQPAKSQPAKSQPAKSQPAKSSTKTTPSKEEPPAPVEPEEPPKDEVPEEPSDWEQPKSDLRNPWAE